LIDLSYFQPYWVLGKSAIEEKSLEDLGEIARDLAIEFLVIEFLNVLTVLYLARPIVAALLEALVAKVAVLDENANEVVDFHIVGYICNVCPP